MLRSVHTRNSILNGLIALVLACNYLAFQAELFDEEYEHNHPLPSGTSSVSSYAANWESFDKDNAPEAFTFDAGLRIDLLLLLQSEYVVEFFNAPPFQLIRDKSPPLPVS